VKRQARAGFSLIELLVVIAIGTILTVMAVPMIINAVRSYQLTAAVSAATGAIQSTRYAAIMHGYPYQITFTPATNSYQIYSMIPPATTYSAQVSTAGGTLPTNPIPITGSGDITISQTITFQFQPGGTVTSVPSNTAFSITNPYGLSNTITVSGVGNVTVTSP
jgi:prepilin-type N-terminal cleavage/methylation domain-containing protein